MKLSSVLKPGKYAKTLLAISAALENRRYAKARGLPSLDFDTLGRQLAMRRLLDVGGLSELLNPVSLVRYFEFDFCERQLPRTARRILDVSSPRLFPLCLAQRRPQTEFVIVNPDRDDLALTQRYVRYLGLHNVHTACISVDEIARTRRGQFDFVSSISVIEHIAGAYDDGAAIRMLADCASPTGVIALTVPLSSSKRHEDEFMPHGQTPYLGTHQEKGPDGRYFFQRLYTADTISSRLLSRVPEFDADLEWWGEKLLGYYDGYRDSGLYNAGADAAVCVDWFQSYDRWDDLPGMGICGIALRRSAH